MQNKKSLGIVLISLYSTISGGIGILLASLILLFSAIPDFPIEVLLASILTEVYSVILLASAYGLWTGQAWGSRLTYWTYLIGVPLSIFSELISPSENKTVGGFVYLLCSIILSFVIAAYLNNRHKKAEFAI